MWKLHFRQFHQRLDKMASISSFVSKICIIKPRIINEITWPFTNYTFSRHSIYCIWYTVYHILPIICTELIGLHMIWSILFGFSMAELGCKNWSIFGFGSRELSVTAFLRHFAAPPCIRILGVLAISMIFGQKFPIFGLNFARTLRILHCSRGKTRTSFYVQWVNALSRPIIPDWYNII